jgi:predicted Fe-Mo cluster-binding NifX family protein
MRICVPTGDDRGLESEAFGHVGGAPYYTIADTDSLQVEVVRAGRHGHGEGECGPAARIRALGIDTLVCTDIGRRALASLEEAGITVLVSDRRTVGEILAAARDGTLHALSADEICAGHGARHDGCGTHGDRRRSHCHHHERPGERAS